MFSFAVGTHYLLDTPSGHKISSDFQCVCDEPDGVAENRKDPGLFEPFISNSILAEGEGFEPSRGYNPPTALAKPPLQPLEYPSAAQKIVTEAIHDEKSIFYFLFFPFPILSILPILLTLFLLLCLHYSSSPVKTLQLWKIS
jgi:hypothetical protein